MSKFWTFFGHIFNIWQGPTYETSTNLWLHTSKGKYWCNSGCVLVPSIFTLALVTWIISLDGVTLHSTNTAVICWNFDNNFKGLLCRQKAGLPSAFVKKCAAASLKALNTVCYNLQGWKISTDLSCTVSQKNTTQSQAGIILHNSVCQNQFNIPEWNWYYYHMLVPVENIKYVQNVSKVLDIFIFRLDIPWTHFLLRRLRCECPKCVQTFGQIMDTFFKNE